MADLATIARPYAEALSSTAKPEEMGAWSEQLNTFAQMASSPDVALLANNPNVSQEQLSGLLLASVKSEVSPAIQKFMTLLTMNHRVAALPEIAKQFEELKNAKEGSAEARITSAFPMSEQEVNALISALTKRFGNRTLKATIEVEPELIGGVRVQVGDEVLDTSVKSRLEAMQAALLS
jgi:F-type H+-transporting ATPase subunit delta